VVTRKRINMPYIYSMVAKDLVARFVILDSHSRCTGITSIRRANNV
jgi:hypothetical protein